MLSSLANPPDGMEGFLMDLEYARLNTITEIHAMKIAPDATTSATHTVFKDAKRGAEMTVSPPPCWDIEDYTHFP